MRPLVCCLGTRDVADRFIGIMQQAVPLARGFCHFGRRFAHKAVGARLPSRDARE